MFNTSSTDALKWFGILVAAGVTTTLVVQYITRYTQAQATQAARAEVQRLLLAATQAAYKPQPTQSAPSQIYTDNTVTIP